MLLTCTELSQREVGEAIVTGCSPREPEFSGSDSSPLGAHLGGAREEAAIGPSSEEAFLLKLQPDLMQMNCVGHEETWNRWKLSEQRKTEKF